MESNSVYADARARVLVCEHVYEGMYYYFTAETHAKVRPFVSTESLLALWRHLIRLWMILSG